jgi:hypothetical protein
VSKSLVISSIPAFRAAMGISAKYPKYSRVFKTAGNVNIANILEPKKLL